MLERYGSRPLPELLAPAIRRAEEGFPLSEQTARFLGYSWAEIPEHVRAFYGRDGRPLAAGETLVQKDLARSFRTIAEKGAGAFYGGEIDPPPLAHLLSEAYWEEEARAFDRARARPFVPPGQVAAQGRNTTHFVVADRHGNVVSATQTLGNLFGSRIMVPGTGIWLNNSLAYCTFEPAGNPMDAHAGRRKLSGDAPTRVMRDGRPWIALGTPGGHTIDQTVPQMVMNLLDFGMDIRAALAAPRISFIEPDVLGVEDRIPEAVRRELAARGHKVEVEERLGNATA